MTDEERVAMLKEQIEQAKREIKELNENKCFRIPKAEFNISGHEARVIDTNLTNSIRSLCKQMSCARFLNFREELDYHHIDYTGYVRVENIPKEKMKILNEFIEEIIPVICTTVKRIVEIDNP